MVDGIQGAGPYAVTQADSTSIKHLPYQDSHASRGFETRPLEFRKDSPHS